MYEKQFYWVPYHYGLRLSVCCDVKECTVLGVHLDLQELAAGDLIYINTMVNEFG